jgi:hypothetical protein
MIYTNSWPGISVAMTWSLIWYSENFIRFSGRISMLIDVSVCYLFYVSPWFNVNCDPVFMCWRSVEVAGNTVYFRAVPAFENIIELFIALFVSFCRHCRSLDGCFRIVSCSFIQHLTLFNWKDSKVKTVFLLRFRSSELVSSFKFVLHYQRS